MASDAPELDLYADDIGDEFAQETYDNDLYDDVLTSSSKQRNNNNNNANNSDDQQQFNGNSNQSRDSSSQNSQNNSNNNSGGHNSNNISLSSSSSNLINNTNNQSTNENTSNHYQPYSQRKPCVYVGNLTWYTTDDDVIKAFGEINVNDVVEVKFFENRANGQSKGFCVVTFQSDTSVRMALEKLKHCQIHGHNPLVTLCNRQNLNNFELKSRKPGINGQQPNQNNNNNNNNNNNTNHHNQNNMNQNHQNQQNNFMQNNRNNFNQNSNMPPSLRPPLIPRPIRPNTGPLLNNQPRLNLQNQSLPYGSGASNSGPQQWNPLMSNAPRNPMGTGSGPLNSLLRFGLGNRQLPNQPLLSAPANQVDLRTQLSSGMAGVQHPAFPATNPLFSSQTSIVPPTPSDMFGSRMAPMGPYGTPHPNANDFTRSAIDQLAAMQQHQGMSEAEFDELMNKNKSLSANAISRAVTDAASGDFSGAIDTLSTAIQLIKSSRVSHDERCKILISSLQDTLQGIEHKSYSSGGGDRDRGGSDRGGGMSSRGKDRMIRSRSRDRDHRGSSSHRSSGRDKDRGSSRRDRSRSRERDYRERSRDRYHEDHSSRYHEDRYREKDRDRDHGRRH